MIRSTAQEVAEAAAWLQGQDAYQLTACGDDVWQITCSGGMGPPLVAHTNAVGLVDLWRKRQGDREAGRTWLDN